MYLSFFIYIYITDHSAPNLFTQNDTVYVVPVGEITLTLDRITKWFGKNVNHIWFYGNAAVVQFFSGRETRNILQVNYIEGEFSVLTIFFFDIYVSSIVSF